MLCVQFLRLTCRVVRMSRALPTAQAAHPLRRRDEVAAFLPTQQARHNEGLVEQPPTLHRTAAARALPHGENFNQLETAELLLRRHLVGFSAAPPHIGGGVEVRKVRGEGEVTTPACEL